MANAVTALSGVLTPAALWQEVATMAPLIGTMVIFAFAYYIYRRFIKGTSHGKAKG